MRERSTSSVSTEVARVRREFAEQGDPERARREKAYHKSALQFHGVSAKQIGAQTRQVLARQGELSRSRLLTLVRGFWKSGYFDLRSVGLGLLDRKQKLLEPKDLAWLERLVRESKGWAHVDWLSTHIVGGLVERNPPLQRELKRWSKDEDFWVRRASMLALLRPLRRGEGDFDLFARFAGPMIEETEFFIRKAIGWVLRDVSRKRPDLSYRFLKQYIEVVSGLTLREGTKYLPVRQREELHKQYRSRAR